ncbi:MAG: UDP-N-acetylmuramoyl-L-alanyl-D-glutamate--2,6-diaminopimelate ligase [Anaerolineales bacterium]|nr:UDP-N-acetylmuramoyl-L-alanyl-D-glutamate--2,6-diaminopimelate ligase [Anaerolineales bacterium]
MAAMGENDPKIIHLSDLLRGLAAPESASVPDTLISGVVMDSRQAQPGSLFVALRGERVDGHRYIPYAIARGAAAVVGEQLFSGLPVPYVQVPDGRAALASLAAAFYDYPARKLTVIGVTGTDGKTTTANLVYHILRAGGLRVGMISTVNALIGDQALDTGFHVTTPEAPDVQRYLSQMVATGLDHVILEATSHGLAQQRVAACEFDMALVTNITHEHLDFHGNFPAYRAAKGLLFASLADTYPKPWRPPHGAVLNRDDDSFDYLAGITSVPVLSYGLGGEADVRAEETRLGPDGLQMVVVGRTLKAGAFRLRVSSPLIGEYNLYNCLAAIALTHGVMELEPQAVQQGLADMQAVPGRMELIEMGQGFLAIVDFAHTPNALRRALQAARGLAAGRVIAVFGSAGLRDRAKRRMMAEISVELADRTVLTAEDPRSELLEAILEQMAAGAEARGGVEGKTFWRIPDRREAIRFALHLASEGDVVMVCGKGHEQSMCFGEIEYPWDDRVALRAALAEQLGVDGPEMPYLPG